MRNNLQWDAYWGSINPSIVDAFEARIGRKLPAAYKAIVSAYNGAYVVDKDAYRFYSNLSASDSIQELGLMHALGGAVDSPAETMAWSMAHTPFGFPDGLLSFARDGGGNLLCFDYRDRGCRDEPAIVVWHLDARPGSGTELSCVAPSFNDFLEILFEE